MSQGAALFGRPTKEAQARHLLQFKAGKMSIKPDNWVHADPRKGWCYIYQAGDGKLHFCWIDRRTCLVEDNFVLTPKQAEFKRVAECTTGRVYLLKGKEGKNFFIWMQEPNGKNDDDICSKVNEYINSPPAVQPTTQSTDWLGGFSSLSHLSQNDLLALLSMGVGFGSGLSSESDVSSAQATAVTISRQLNTGHLETQPTSVVGGTAAAATPSSTAGRSGTASGRPEVGKIQLQDLQNILASVASTATKNTEPPVDLNDVLNMENLRELLSRADVRERLAPHLPPSDSQDTTPTDSLGNISTNIHSSQFKSTVKSFSNALRTGELAPVLAQFNLGAKADEAARRGDIVAFAQALQLSADQTPTPVQPTTISTSLSQGSATVKLPPADVPPQLAPSVETEEKSREEPKEEVPEEATQKHGDSFGPERMDTDE